MVKFDSCENFEGRMNGPVPCSNGDTSIPATFEVMEPIPRGYPPTRDYNTLSVINLNMYEQSNKMAHRTIKYDNNNLIVRRGQEFVLGVVFNRPFNPQNDVANIEFMIGNYPSPTDGTLITVPLGKSTDQRNLWKGRVLGGQGAETKVGITPTADCIVGLFSTYVTVITSQGKRRTERDHRTDIYILFNAWNPSDMVFMANEADRAEYVLNSVGVIYNGTVDDVEPRPWDYGQFQHGVLDACLFVLDMGKVPLPYRGDVVKLSRQASAMINSQDDNGVIVGNWSDTINFGTPPTAWTGSAEILLSYASKGGEPVKYGQCWVFAGVFNTLLRCLGLPARVITNYCSAHDNMGDVETDIVLDEDGQMDSTYTRDSIWNFHCWNEVFTKRPDLPALYSGWQLVDSTPQETSEGYYRCGPTSVRAIKDGELGYMYDAHFVFAEVNSNVIFHKRDKYGNMKVVDVDTTYVGQLILTKMIGSNNPADVTNTYKYSEGSAEDRRSMQHAGGESMDDFIRSSPLPVDMQLQLLAKQVNPAGDIVVTARVSNLSKEGRKISLSITSKTVYYTGATRHKFKFVRHDMSLQAWETKDHIVKVTATEYTKYMSGQPFLSFMAYGLVSETGVSLTSMAAVHVNAPPLLIEMSGDPVVGKNMSVTVKFTNTAGHNLSDVTLRLEGSELMTLKTKLYSNIPNGSTVKWTESFSPQKVGPKSLVACLDCASLRNVCGQVDVDIK